MLAGVLLGVGYALIISAILLGAGYWACHVK